MILPAELPEDPEVRPRNCMQQNGMQLSLMGKKWSGSEVTYEREIFDHRTNCTSQ
jgi:hypothetical protein